MTINNVIAINQNGKLTCLFSDKYGEPTDFGKKLIKVMKSKELMNKSASQVADYLKNKYKALSDKPKTKKIDFVYTINLFDDQNTLVCEYNDIKKKQMYNLFGLAVDSNWEEFDHFQMVGMPYMWD